MAHTAAPAAVVALWTTRISAMPRLVPKNDGVSIMTLLGCISYDSCLMGVDLCVVAIQRDEEPASGECPRSGSSRREVEVLVGHGVGYQASHFADRPVAVIDKLHLV